jgi:hypothetical protein
MGNLLDSIKYLHLPYVVYDGTPEMAEQIFEWSDVDFDGKDIQDPFYGRTLTKGDVIMQNGVVDFSYITKDVFESMGHFKDEVINEYKVIECSYIRSDVTIETLEISPIGIPGETKTVYVYNDQGLYYSVLPEKESLTNFLENNDTSARVFCGNEIEAYDFISRLKI